MIKKYKFQYKSLKDPKYIKDRTGFGLSALFEEEMSDRKKGY